MQQGARGAGRRAAFTLVELMVVIAIIAVLIAILLPVLHGINDKARLLQCSNNMRQLVTTTVNLAIRNKNQLPPSPAGPNIDDLTRPIALDGIIGTDTQVRRLTACPANFNGGISYLYNPHPALVNFVNKTWTGNTAFRWRTLTQHPKRRALIVDRIREPGRTAHVFSKTKEGAWNMGFTDGSVQSVYSKEVYARLKVVMATNWADLNDDIRILELTAQNRDFRLGAGGTVPYGANVLYPFCTVGEPVQD